MDPRLPYALGALAGLARADAAHSDTLEASDGPGCEVATSAMAVALQLLRAPGEDCATHSGTQLPTAASADARLMCAIPVGIALSTVDLEAFAETVWRVCGCTSRNEFQSAALLAAAVSIGINTRIYTRPLSYTDPLWDAVDVVSAMPPRGETDSSPDVLEVAQRTLKAVANTQSDLRSSPAPVLQETLSDCAPSSRIVPLAFFLAASPQGADEASKCFALSGSPALCEAVAETLSGIFKPTGVLPEPNLAQCSESAQPDWLGITGQLLELHPLTPIKWIRRALGDSIPRVPRRDPSPFEASESGASTRAAADGPRADEQRDSNAAEASSGRVIVMSELMLRYDRGSEEDPIPAGNEWTTRKGVYLSLPFTVMRAARAMGVEVISLSPIGQGPRASVITEALAREGIVDAGPRIAGYDNGFLSVLTTRFNGTKKAGITGMLEDAWDEAIRMLGPSDVLYIDASIAESQEILAAAEHALAHLPHHVRVILDSSGGHIGPRCLPSGNVLMVLGHGAAERLCLQIVCDRSSHDSTRNPNHAASYVLSLFKRQALVITQTHESFLARPKSRREDEVISFPAPTVISTDPVGTLDVSTGVLAAGFVLGCTIERSILLANCAGALASTMPGPTSCPTRAAVETAADTLADRTDASWQRRGRAYGALAGVAAGDAVALPVRGMSPTQIEKQYKTRWILIDADASHPTMPGAPAGTLTEVTREVLAAASHLLDDAPSTNEAGAKDEDLLAGSCYPLRAIPVGIANSTADPQAFVDAVWQVCGNDGLSRQEFHAAALVAAAVSLGIDHKALWLRGMRDVLDEAITYVSALPARGTSAPGPDVLAAARAAIDIVTNYRSDALERLRDQIGTSADPAQSVPAAFGLVAHYSDGFSAFLSVSLGGESSIISAIAGSIVGAAWGVTHFSSHNLATIEKVSRPALAPLAERLVERRVYVSDDAASN